MIFHTKVLLTYIKYLITAVTLYFITLLADWAGSNSLLQKVFLLLGVAFAAYWVASIFVFLWKRSLYSSYTTVIQRYWKRSFYLFWVLEGFLFSIYIYLVLVAPTEVEWLLDQPYSFHNDPNSGSVFTQTLIYPLLLILATHTLQLNLANSSNASKVAVLILLTGVLGVVVGSETFQVTALSMYFNGLSWVYDGEGVIWSLETDMDKMRTINQYIYLMTVLKYWHVLFILAVWLMTLTLFIESGKLFHGSVALNRQNFTFLYMFSLLGLVFSYKTLTNKVSEYVYYWFHVNSNHSFISAFVNLDILWGLV